MPSLVICDSILVAFPALSIDIYRPPFDLGCLKVSVTVFEAERPAFVENETLTLTFKVFRFLSDRLALELNATLTVYVAAFEADLFALRTEAPDTEIRPADGTLTFTFAAKPETGFRPDTATEAATRSAGAARFPLPPKSTEPTAGAKGGVEAAP